MVNILHFEFVILFYNYFLNEVDIRYVSHNKQYVNQNEFNICLSQALSIREIKLILSTCNTNVHGMKEGLIIQEALKFKVNR